MKQKRFYKGLVAIVMAIFMVLGMMPGAPVNAQEIGKVDISSTWQLLDAQRGGENVSKETREAYFKSIADALKANNGNLGASSSANSATEYAKAILGLTALGYDAKNVNGYNVLEGLADFNKIVGQGSNAAVFSLIALDCHESYSLPSGASTSKQKLIDMILEHQMSDGGFSYYTSGEWAGSDIDMTAMALQSLAPYMSDSRVSAATDNAINYLTTNQKDFGGYESWGSASSESCAQVVIALCTLGIDPQSDARFVKSGGSVLDALKSFWVEDGNNSGFCHEIGAGIDAYATEQGTRALVSYKRYTNGNSSIYDMKGTKLEVGKVSSDTDQGTYVLRLFNTINGDHFYTTNVKEAENASKVAGYIIESKSYMKVSDSGVDVYRLFNKYTGEHMYTVSATEKENAINNCGYIDEGVAFKALESGKPVYRCYNPKSSDHFYTTSESEKNNARKNGIYVYEGIAFYVN